MEFMIVVIIAEGMYGAKNYQIVTIGTNKILGEIVKLQGDQAFIQPFENSRIFRSSYFQMGFKQEIQFQKLVSHFQRSLDQGFQVPFATEYKEILSLNNWASFI